LPLNQHIPASIFEQRQGEAKLNYGRNWRPNQTCLAC